MQTYLAQHGALRLGVLPFGLATMVVKLLSTTPGCNTLANAANTSNNSSTQAVHGSDTGDDMSGMEVLIVLGAVSIQPSAFNF